ncbi:MAG: hypothetical protein L6R35_000684 [Caloplaca aegaea]|nr:MAG: hypothetical protein L6R35_000684 [Caloplaca aegaea]
MSEGPFTIMSMDAQASQDTYKRSEFSHLGYAWWDFETEEDLAEAELYNFLSSWKEHDDTFSPLRDPESPFDQGDVQRFEMRTARLANLSDNCSDSVSTPATPYLQPMVSEDEYDDDDGLSDPESSLPPPLSADSDSQDVDAARDPFAGKNSEFEQMMEDRQNQHEQRVADVIGKLISRIDELIAERLPSGESQQMTEAEPYTNSATSHTLLETYPELASTSHAPQIPNPELAAVEKYTQAWHAGGLILVENISDSTPAREIYALFQVCGKITYMELHGPDRSQPHVPTRHAYIHYAEHCEAQEAQRLLHGFHFQDRTLMVFSLRTAAVRGTPGVPYEGSALEVLNFNGGPNYASPEPFWDFYRTHDGMLQMDHQDEDEDEEDLPMPASPPTTQAGTYSIWPQLTTETSPASWRAANASAADAVSEEVVDPFKDKSTASVDDNEEIVFFTGRTRWSSRLSSFATASEREEEDEGGVPLVISSEIEDGEDEEESNFYLPTGLLSSSDDEEDFFCYCPSGGGAAVSLI